MSAFVNNGLASWRRSHASLLAGAMGDSLGADIEFLSLAQIRLRFPEGLTALPPHEGIAGAVTDDTQMTLFTAEGLIRAVVRGTLRGICHPPSVVHHALLRWYRTQGGRPAMDTDDVGLVRDKRLHAVRAPGNTCLHALREARAFGQPARNASKGCGTIMRVAPVALIARPDNVFRLAMETSALTHGHPTGQIAAAAWALLLSNVMAGAALEAAAEEIAQRCIVLDGGKETAAAIHVALNAPRAGRPETVESLGGGWIAEEALSIALYCSLAAADLESGLRMAVMHGGDSDSTGAIAGNMLGLLFPDQVFQHPWSCQVECADLIADLARDLHDAQMGGEAWAESVFERYPGS